jgi:hypothetical protein
MKLTDIQIEYFVSKVLKLPQGKRKDYLDQVDFLIGRLESKIDEDGSFRVTGFKTTGSLVKGTSLRPAQLACRVPSPANSLLSCRNGTGRCLAAATLLGWTATKC